MRRIKQNFKPKLEALTHQVEAIEYLVKNTNAALFDEQGLGKTKIVIDALCIAMEKHEIESALIVAPLSLTRTWELEIKKHSHLIPIILRGSKREKKYKFLTGANFYITNYEAISAELERIKRFCKSRKIAIVLDEAARIKNPNSQTAQTLYEIAPIATKRIVMTGTPIANKPYDIWSLFYFLDRGTLLGNNFEAFRAKYDEKSPGYAIELEELRHILINNSIRRLKQDVLELPEKIFMNITVELHGRQLEMYKHLRDELIIEIINTDGTKLVNEIENILEKFLRLIQIATNPKLVDHNYKDLPAKLPTIKNLVKEIVIRGEKTIVWSSFIENILKLEELLLEYNPLLIYGDIPMEERIRIVNQFQDSEKNRVLIANPAAAREGLTLTKANNAIYLDRNFNLVDYLQSQDRIHRISQTKRCMIYKIIARGTIDEYVDLIIDLKTDVARFLQGDTNSVSEESINILHNKQELLHLLGGAL